MIANQHKVAMGTLLVLRLCVIDESISNVVATEYVCRGRIITIRCHIRLKCLLASHPDQGVYLYPISIQIKRNNNFRGIIQSI